MRSFWIKRGWRWSAAALIGMWGVVAQAAEDAPSQPAEQAPAAPAAAAEIAPAPGVQIGPFEAGRLFSGQVLQTVKLSDYWLGVNCMRVPPALRSHLQLDAEGGLLVEEVVPDSPAAKAGLQAHDIVLSAGDTVLKDVEDLVTLLDNKRDEKLTFKIIRAGERQEVAVQAEKRPEVHGAQDVRRFFVSEAGRAVGAAPAQGQQTAPPVRLQFLHPGIVLPSSVSVALAEKFPDDLKVEIRKQGDKPAEITVERGDKKWSVTDDKLADLPDDVRPHVEGLLGRLPLPKFDVQLNRINTAPQGGVRVAVPAAGRVVDRVDERLKKMEERLEQFREQLQQLRGNQTEAPQVEKAPATDSQ